MLSFNHNNMKSKKLLIITGSLGSGGLEKMTAMIANHFSQVGWNVAVLTLLQNSDNNFRTLSEKVLVSNFKAPWDVLHHKIKTIIPWIKFIKENLKLHSPDTILCMTFKIGALTGLSSRKYKKKIVIREISDPKSKSRSQFFNKVLEFLCRKSKRFIFQTNWERSCFGKKTRLKSVVIPNPCEVKSKAPTLFDNRIICTSRLSYVQKRYDIVLKVFEIIANKYSNIELVIYGSGPDEQDIKDRAAKLPCFNRIHFEGAQKNIPEKILGARCFLMTSDYEGLSNSLLEACLCGVPCVSSDWPGVESIISNGNSGLIYHRQDIQEAASCIEKIINDENLCSKLSNNGIKQRSEFEPQKIFSMYEDALE